MHIYEFTTCSEHALAMAEHTLAMALYSQRWISETAASICMSDTLLESLLKGLKAIAPGE